MKTVIVSGAIANKPFNGGATWTRLSWALGFAKLGFRVFFVEHIARATCVDGDGATVPFERCENLRYFRRVTSEFGLSDSAVLIYESAEQVHGAAWEDLLEIARSCDLLVNISGHLDLQPLFAPIRRKVYIDLDPGFTQLWHAGGKSASRLAGHDLYYTVGENMGTSQCSIPTAGVPWRPIRQPVVLEHWPVSREGNPRRFTTVASWRGAFGPIEHGGRILGAKVHEFRAFAGLPKLLDGEAEFELALEIHPADTRDVELLRRNGWRAVDPKVVCGGPASFRHYVQASGAEFSVAQGMYVQTRSGWFSDRSVRYLASGKPVVVQETGIGHRYPTGRGLLTFDSMDTAAAAVREVVANYDQHAAAARQLAERYFDSDKVLGPIAEETGIAP